MIELKPGSFAKTTRKSTRIAQRLQAFVLSASPLGSPKGNPRLTELKSGSFAKATRKSTRIAQRLQAFVLLASR